VSDEVAAYVKQLLDYDGPPASPASPEPVKSQFVQAVERLMADGLDHRAARQLINNAVDRGSPIGLLAWADHLVEQRRKYRELAQRVPR
jgi:hypothetical protein